MDDATQAVVCYRHPDRETKLACSVCGKPICVDCSHDAAVGQKCAECARPTGRHRVIDARRTTGPLAGLKATPVSRAILVVTIAVYAIQFLSADANRSLLLNFAHDNQALAMGELWRILTHALLHGSPLHLLFNMYALYLFGPALERRVGSVPFALFYAAAAAAGSALSFLIGPASMLAVGASGAIFGLFGAWIFVSWRLRNERGGRQSFNQLAGLLLINLLLPLFIPTIAWQAHAGGLVAGVGMAWFWGRWASGSDEPRLRRSIVAGATLIAAFVVVAVVSPLG